MKQLISLAALAAASLAVASPAAAQRAPAYGATQDEEMRFDQAQQRFDREYQAFQDAIERYRAYRSRIGNGGGYPPPPPPRGGMAYDDRGPDPLDDQYYDPVRDYRAPPPGYRDRVLTEQDRVYRGSNGQYYCKRSDGTTGLVVGAAAGGLFGNAISNGHSRTLGTLFGAIVGGVAGSTIERNQVRCQ